MNYQQQSLADKRVVIIGGTSGVGLAVANAAAHEGAYVIVASSRQASIDEALKQLPDSVEGRVLNVLEESAVKEFFANLGKIDHLVFTAGEELQMKNIDDLTITEARKFFDTRYWGAFTSVKYAAPNISSGGSIVLTSASVAVRPAPGTATAASITAAIEAMTKELSLELAPKHIRTNVVRLGPVRTPLWDKSVADPDAIYEMFAGQLPVGRMGESDEVAQAYLFLMSNTFATGSIVTVDGGHVLV